MSLEYYRVKAGCAAVKCHDEVRAERYYGQSCSKLLLFRHKENQLNHIYTIDAVRSSSFNILTRISLKLPRDIEGGTLT